MTAAPVAGLPAGETGACAASVALVLSPTCARAWHLGVETVPAQLSRDLARRGHPVVLILPTRAPAASRLRPPGVRVRRPPPPPERPERRSVSAYRSGIGWALELRRHRVRVAHLLGFYTEQDARAAWVATRAARVPYVLSRITLAAQTAPDARRWTGPWLRRLHEGAASVAAVSRRAAQECRELFPALREERLEVVPLGVDTELFGAPPASPSGKARILCLGRQIAYKGLDVLVLAFSDLLRSGVRAELVLAGPDHSGGHVRSLVRALGVERRVRFEVHAGARRVKAALDRCELVVLPSRLEAFGMAALEAMAAGKPVVVSRGAAVSELIEDGRDGLLVDPGDAAGLASAIRRLLADPRLRSRLAAAGRMKAEGYSWARYGERMHAALHRACADGRGARPRSS